MVSYAIIHRIGTERYLNDAVTAGIDGLIVPDLPVEEAAGLLQKATVRGLKLIQLITPTTPRERGWRSHARPRGLSTTSRWLASRASGRRCPRIWFNRSAGCDTQTDLPDMHRLRYQRSRPDTATRSGGGRPDRG